MEEDRTVTVDGDGLGVEAAIVVGLDTSPEGRYSEQYTLV